MPTDHEDDSTWPFNHYNSDVYDANRIYGDDFAVSKCDECGAIWERSSYSCPEGQQLLQYNYTEFPKLRLKKRKCISCGDKENNVLVINC